MRRTAADAPNFLSGEDSEDGDSSDESSNAPEKVTSERQITGAKRRICPDVRAPPGVTDPPIHVPSQVSAVNSGMGIDSVDIDGDAIVLWEHGPRQHDGGTMASVAAAVAEAVAVREQACSQVLHCD
jgi:hypothetical protein